MSNLIYAASRASVPERPRMWRELRDQGYGIISSWIDEAGYQETNDMSELWQRVASEIRAADRLVLYVEPDDFPLKGALVEVGIAIGTRTRVFVVAPGVGIGPDYRPLGSWLRHPLVKIETKLSVALGPKVPAPRVPAHV